MTTTYKLIRNVNAALVFVLLSLAALHCNAQIFTEWADSPETKRQLANEAESYGTLYENEGFEVAFQKILSGVQSLSPTTAEDTERRQRFLNLLNLSNQASVESIMNQPIGTDVATIASHIRSSARTLRGNQIKPTKLTTRSGYAICETGDNAIIIDKTSESQIDRELWRYSWMFFRITGDLRLPVQEQTVHNTEAARKRWSKFMGNVVHDQYIWETLVNGRLGERARIFGGSLTQPPTRQLRLLHPYPVVAYSNENSSEFTPRIAVDVLGYRKLDRDYQAKYAWSVVTLLPGREEEDFGWGITWSHKNYSIGVVTRDVGNDDDVITVMLGVKTAGLLENTRTDLKQLADKKLDELLAQIRNGP